MIDDKDDVEQATYREIELPHDAFLTIPEGVVSLQIDKFTLHLSIEEFNAFCTSLEDIKIYLEQLLNKTHEECPTCGTHLEVMSVTPLKESDFN